MARRGGLAGLHFKDEVKCDMIAESCRDLISKVAEAPFKYESFYICRAFRLPQYQTVEWIFLTRSDYYAQCSAFTPSIQCISDKMHLP